jgi:DNA-binding NarL/FixJ family response regulator
MSIQVAVVEVYEEIRSSLERIIKRTPNLSFVCGCSSGEAALETLPQSRPQVVVMDLGLPGMSGIECIARLKRALPETQMLVLTVYGDNDQVFKALEAGASGYLLKRSKSAEIVQAVMDVYDGGSPMTGEIARKVVQSFRKADSKTGDDTGDLTSREENVLHLLAQGYASKEIADKLSVRYDTVRFHLKNIYTKLHVRSRVEAIIKYFNEAR